MEQVDILKYLGCWLTKDLKPETEIRGRIENVRSAFFRPMENTVKAREESYIEIVRSAFLRPMEDKVKAREESYRKQYSWLRNL